MSSASRCPGRNQSSVHQKAPAGAGERIAGADERERRAARPRHKESRTLGALLDAIPESAFVIDLDGIVVQANGTAAKRLGTTLQKLCGSSVKDWVSAELAKARGKRVEAAVRTGKPQRFEDQRSGRHYDIILSPVRDTEGKVTQVAIVGIDVTQRVQFEETLRESERRFRAIAEYSNDWENWVDPDGRLKWVNPPVERITGYTVDECMAMEGYPIPLIHEDDAEAIAQVFEGAVSGRTCGKDLRFRFRRKDGTVRWGAVSWQPIFDTDGTCLGHRSSIRDVSDRAEAEARAKDKIDLLTPRERQVLVMLAAGKTVKAIALQLGLSPKTVQVHRAHILEKTAVSSAPELVWLASDAGVLRHFRE
jgi:PAS domain S-box-containing protein